jgi:hypothetical protein
VKEQAQDLLSIMEKNIIIVIDDEEDITMPSTAVVIRKNADAGESINFPKNSQSQIKVVLERESVKEVFQYVDLCDETRDTGVESPAGESRLGKKRGNGSPQDGPHNGNARVRRILERDEIDVDDPFALATVPNPPLPLWAESVLLSPSSKESKQVRVT